MTQTPDVGDKSVGSVPQCHGTTYDIWGNTYNGQMD